MTLILLPLLAMHFCTYVIIGPKGDIQTQVAKALAPFDESLEVDPYKVYMDEAEIKRMAAYFGVEERSPRALVEKMPDWSGASGDSTTSARSLGVRRTRKDGGIGMRAVAGGAGGSAGETSSTPRPFSTAPT